uniref:Uncharacterized protein n=1 Tax=Leersia perrieri TaxID=77586 RepID=A0A0D9VPV9_9ORYZ
MASSSAMVRVVVVAVLLMQFCNAIMAARLLDGELAGSWLQGGVGGGELVLQMLKNDNGQSPGAPSGCHQPGGSSNGGGCP